MGQYHALVNFDKKEYLNPSSIALMAKQWEHQSDPQYAFAGSLSDALYILVMTSPNRGNGDMPLTPVSGRWAGDRVMVLGDYTEDSDLPEEMNGGSLNEIVYDTYKEIGAEMREAFSIVYGFKWHTEELGSFTFWQRTFSEDVEAVANA